MMECNRDEALRAKEICEKKLASQDYQGALKFLQKALQLFPGLENTSQLSAVLDVHIAAQSKINGIETDWYGVLQVDPKADDILVKKQYKKLALLLHPDKNKYAGAESAFKLIGEALQVLSDKQQRSLHDSRRKPVVGRSTSTAPRSQNRQTNMPSYASRQSATSALTFITMCPSCHTRYQYYRIYENQNLLCHQCHTPFLAREISMGNGAAYTTYSWQHFNHQQPRFNHASFHSFPGATNFPGAANFPGAKMPDFHTSVPPFTGASRGGNMSAGHMADHLNQGMRERQAADTSQGVKRKRSQDDKEAEKEIRKMEKEQQRKAKADQRAQEALEKMLKKQKEQADRAARDKKRKQKRRLSDSSEDDEDEDESDSLDYLSDEETVNNVTNNAVDPNSAPRRSSRPRRNVTYKVDVSDDEENPSEHKKAGNQNGIENESQNGDCVDFKEKQKLADMFKIKIRVNLNLQNSSKSSAKPNGASVDSNTVDVRQKKPEKDDSRQGKSVEDKSGSETNMDHAKDTAKEQDMEQANASNKKEYPQQESIKKEDVEHVMDSVNKEDMDQVSDSVKPNDREQVKVSVKTNDQESTKDSEKKQDMQQTMDSIKKPGMEQAKGSVKRKNTEDMEHTRSSVKKKNLERNMEPVKEKRDMEQGKDASKKKVLDEDMEQAMDSKQKQAMKNEKDSKQKQTKGSLRRKSTDQPLEHAKEFKQKQANEHAKDSTQKQGSEHTKGSLRRKSMENHFEHVKDSIEKQPIEQVMDSKQKLNFEQSKCSTRRKSVEEDVEQAKNSIQAPTMEQAKVSLRRKNMEPNNEQAKGPVKRKEIEQEKDQATKQNLKRLRNSAKKKNTEQNSTAEVILKEEESEEPGKPANFAVPDPDFYKFDREEKDVSPGQIWATYDDTDCLPRFYCKVKDIESRRPFAVNIVWLELRNMTEHQRSLKQAGYLPACGGCFRSSYSQKLETVSNFSHILKFEKGPKGIIKIYPRKGDVWALYSNWKPGIIPKKVGATISWKYQMVEVLKDFSEGTCISVVILDKLKGFKTVYKRTEACLEIRETELCKFSHQVPAHKLKGNEAPGIKEGCWELDPASVPTSLLKTSIKS